MNGKGVFDDHDDAATPLTPDERQGLIPTYITTRTELNEAEHLNIVQAEAWTSRRRRDVLDVAFMRRLHQRMFGKVWRWAGEWTGQRDRRIGVDHWRVETELTALIEDVTYWVAHETYPADEIAARFHHKLTWIHPFPNGNGRFARMATDLLLLNMNRPRFSWGAANMVEPNETRQRYVAALKSADHRDIEALLAFVRS